MNHDIKQRKVLFVNTSMIFPLFLQAAFQSNEIDAYACVWVMNSDKSASVEKLGSLYGIPSDKLNKARFFFWKTNRYIRYLSTIAYLKAIKKFAVDNGIRDIHCIGIDLMFAHHLRMFKDYTLYYTVHDVDPHPAKSNLPKRLKRWFFEIRRQQYLLRHIPNLVTCSEHQFEKLKKTYPTKNIFKHNMPNEVLVSQSGGNTAVPELANEKDYVLFFGRIEAYKGIELLYKCFQQNKALRNKKLVIAGKGSIYFERDTSNEANIIFINRRIADEEIKWLFQHAAVLVLPYTTATQSGVSSFAYFFKKPVIASNIGGLWDTIIDGKTGLLFKQNDIDDLAEKIIRLLSNEQAYQAIVKEIEATNIFDVHLLAKQIAAIYIVKKNTAL